MSTSDRIRIKVQQWPFVKLPTDLLVDRKVSASAKVTYLALCFWAREHGSTFALHDNVRAVAGVSRRTFYEHLAKLEEQGWLKRSRTEGGLCETTVLVRKSAQGVRSAARGGCEKSHGGGAVSRTHTEKLFTEKLSTESTPLGSLFDGVDQKPKPKAKPPVRVGPLVKSELLEFEAWYQQYPKRVAKGDGRKAWRKARANFETGMPGLSKLIRLTEQWWEARQATDGSDLTYVPGPGPWLNQERWADELSPSKPAFDPEDWEARARAEEAETRRMLEEQGNA